MTWSNVSFDRHCEPPSCLHLGRTQAQVSGAQRSRRMAAKQSPPRRGDCFVGETLRLRSTGERCLTPLSANPPRNDGMQGK